MSNVFRRGDVVMAPFGAQEFIPVVTLSEGIYNQKSGTIIGVPLFQGKPAAGFPLTVQLTKQVQGHNYYAKPGQIKTFSILSLGYVVDHVDVQDLKEIISGLGEILNEPIL